MNSVQLCTEKQSNNNTLFRIKVYKLTPYSHLYSNHLLSQTIWGIDYVTKHLSFAARKQELINMKIFPLFIFLFMPIFYSLGFPLLKKLSLTCAPHCESKLHGTKRKSNKHSHFYIDKR